MTPERTIVCPACGGPNECAPAQSGSFAAECWCSAVTIDPAALARLPDEERGRACLCRRCLAAVGSNRHAP